MARGFDESKLMEIETYIQDYQKEYKRSPSIREICNHFASFFKRSFSKCQRYLHELEITDRINYTKGKGIDVEPVLLSGHTTKVSLVGNCPCGVPALAVENIEGTFDLPTEIFGESEHFMVRAVGNSMINAGIFDGDYMVVRRQNGADSGQIVVALINDEVTAKIFLPQREYAILRAANDAEIDGERIYKDIKTRECSILGVVDNVIHRPVVRSKR